MSDKPALDAAELLAAVVADAPIVLFALDADGVFTLSMGRGLEALGRKAGEVVGKSVFDVYAEHPQILSNCRRALAGETVSDLVPINGLVFETRYRPRLDWGGKVAGIVGVATDVTATRAAALAHDEFLSAVSHELRTPLTGAIGWSWMLREGGLGPEEEAKAHESVARTLEDLKRMIKQLRDAAASATGRLVLTTSECDLAALVREAAAAEARAVEAKGVALDLPQGTLRGKADPARFRQVAWTLISNAVKFSPDGGRVTVRLERVGRMAELTVSDQGPGLPADIRARVFDRLQAPSLAKEGGHRGLGVGLTVARRIVELHGGTLTIADSPAGGAVFQARLPQPAR